SVLTCCGPSAASTAWACPPRCVRWWCSASPPPSAPPRPASSSDPAMSHQDASPQPRQEEPPSAWEWLAAGVGLLLLLASLGYLLHDAAAGNGQSPAPEVRVTGIEAQG